MRQREHEHNRRDVGCQEADRDATQLGERQCQRARRETRRQRAEHDLPAPVDRTDHQPEDHECGGAEDDQVPQ